MKRLPLVVLFCLVLAVGVHVHIRGKYRLAESGFTQMLYLPSGKYLKYASLGYDSLVADFIYLWSIQYYTDPGFHPRTQYLKHTYDIITELDPGFIDAYQTGALLMFYEGRDPKSAFALLDKGFQRNPEQWIFPADAGFYAMMRVRNYELADRYFEKASRVPGAPTIVMRMLAGLRFRRGDKVQAYELWMRVYETADMPSVKRIAFQHVQELKVLIDLEVLHKQIADFHLKYGRNPFVLEQLVTAGMLREVPLDPDGRPYLYDPQTGKIEYSGKIKLYRKYQ